MAWISNNIENLINYRISQEEYSSRLYLAMSNWLQNNGYDGASKLFKKWADEEMVKTTYWNDRLEEFGDSKSSLLAIDNEMSENL